MTLQPVNETTNIQQTNKQTYQQNKTTKQIKSKQNKQQKIKPKKQRKNKHKIANKSTKTMQRYLPVKFCPLYFKRNTVTKIYL